MTWTLDSNFGCPPPPKTSPPPLTVLEMDWPHAGQTAGNVPVDPGIERERDVDMLAGAGNGTIGEGTANRRCGKHMWSPPHRALVCDRAAHARDAFHGKSLGAHARSAPPAAKTPRDL